MAVDYSRIGVVVQRQMEAIETDYPEGTDAEIGIVVVLTEITLGGERELRIRSSTDQGGEILRAVLRAATNIAEGAE